MKTADSLRALALSAAALVLATGSLRAQDEYWESEEAQGGFSGVLRGSAGVNRVTGQGEDSSFLDEGAVWTQEADIRYDALFDGFDHPLKLGLDASLRYAHDTAVDPEHKLKVMKLSLEIVLDDPQLVREAVLGDFYANLSQYTFSQSAKGAKFHGKYGDKNQFDAILFGGVVKPNWDGFFRQEEGELQTRWVTGARFEQRFSPKFTYGLNAALVRDNAASGDSSFTEAERNKVLSLDVRFRPVRWYNLTGEAAYSRYVSDVGGENAKSGNAVRLKNNFRIKRARLDADYERVSTHFTSLAGSAAADREQYYVKLRCPLGSKIELKASYKDYHDNLNGHDPAGTTFIRHPLLQLDLRPFESRRDFRTYVGCKDRLSWNDDTQNRTKKLTRTVTAGVADRLGDFDYNVSLERRLFWNYEDGDQDTESWRINTRTGYRFRVLGTTELYPYLDATSFRKNYTDTSEKSYNVILGGGLRCEVGDVWNCNASYRRDDYDDSTPDRAVDAVRDTVRVGVTRRFGERQQHEVTLNYREMQFDHETAANDYNEQQLWLECMVAF